MENMKIYEDIAARTGGDVYVGVVGPVRTGKSTFIKRFMETLVIPGIESDYVRERAKDELPQSGSGRTIMTAEPKFVPEEAVSLNIGGDSAISVRLVDCVGYMVDGAVGDTENGEERMVTTPWFPEEVSMRIAAETGTRKVIAEHSTIGIVITTDGSVTDIPRESYVPAEARVIRELKELGKPFIVLLNSAHPDSAETSELAAHIAEEYSVTCLAVNCMLLSEDEIGNIMSAVLGEFPIREFRLFIPEWMETLPRDHELKKELFAAVLESLEGARLIREARPAALRIGETDGNVTAELRGSDMGSGAVIIDVSAPRALFYSTVSGMTGFEIKDDGDMISLLSELSGLKSEYEKVADALRDVRETGYGVVMPSKDDLTLREPEIVRRGGKYSVRLKASAPSIHMIMTDVETEVSPAVGGERSSGDVINFLLQEFEGDTGKLWESNIFGRSLHDIAGDSVQAKIRSMPPETQIKMRDTLGRIINEGAGGLICIIL